MGLGGGGGWRITGLYFLLSPSPMSEKVDQKKHTFAQGGNFGLCSSAAEQRDCQEEVIEDM